MMQYSIYPIALFILLLSGCKPQPAQMRASVEPPQGTNLSQKFWQVPAFELVDQDGNAFNSGAMLGRVWVIDFFYTSCPGPCPALTSRLSELHKKLSSENRVAFLSISSDPEKDKPEILKKYAVRFGADQRWFFLTGPVSTVFSIANQGFKVSLTKIENSPEPVTHSTKLILVDSKGWVRGFFEGVGEETGEASKRLEEAIRVLLKE
jgi:protein SCO1/2